MSDGVVPAADPQALSRDCLDPWTYVEVRVNGDIAPCCVRGPVGNIAEASLAEILSGEPIRQLRAELASGELDPICAGCRQRAPIAPEMLRQKIRAVRREVQLPPGFDAAAYFRANPDLGGDADAEWHFRNFGYLEGRPLRPDGEMVEDAVETASDGPLALSCDLVGGIAQLPVTGKPVRRLAAAMLVTRRKQREIGENGLAAVLRGLPLESRTRTAEAIVEYFENCAGRAGLLGAICRRRLSGLDTEAQAATILGLVAAYGWRL